MRRILLGLLVACSSPSATVPDASTSDAAVLPTSPSKLDANDVSVVFPLPSSASDLDALLSPASKGLRGELLPEADFAKPLQELTLYDMYNGRARLRVVAVRIDPCFPRIVTDDAQCKNQIRLVMQPVVIPEHLDAYTGIDAAVHLFYEVSREEMKKVIGEIAAVKDKSASTAGPLGVNPAIASEGIRGSYAKGIEDIVLAHSGADNLTRITFTQLTGSVNIWNFGGFDRKGGMLVPIGIAKTATTLQVIENNAVGDYFGGEIKPMLDERDKAFEIMMDVDRAKNAAIADIEKAGAAAVFVENPEKISPEEATCVSCHVAEPFRRWMEKNRGISTKDLPDRFAKSPTIDTPAMSHIDNVRAFGWRNDQLSISQRTANETVGVVDYVNTRLR